MSQMQAPGQRDEFRLNPDFVWLIGPYDVLGIAEKLGRDWSEIENILIHDLLMRQVTVFYIPDGTFKKYSYAVERHRPKHVLEKFFLEEIRERPLAWDDIWASVTRVDEETYNDAFMLHLESRVDGELRSVAIRLPIHEWIQSGLSKDEFFSLVWEDMIRTLDDTHKQAKYGPR